MIQCVTSGVKIHIVHNIERNLAEISEAIRSWLPLYPLGQIESFYLNGQKNTNFSTTLFLCPGYACIYGNNVVGTENESGMYLYETEPSFLDVQLIISEKSVAVSRLTAPFFTIFLEHPFLCRAFVEYADSVKKQYTLDKVTLKRKLEECLLFRRQDASEKIWRFFLYRARVLPSHLI